MAETKEAPKLLKVNEVAERLNCNPNHVWTMIYRRDIASIVIGKRSRRVSEAAVNEVIERGMIPIRPELA